MQKLSKEQTYEWTSTSLLQYLLVLIVIWEEIRMDFIDGLTISHGKSTILVAADMMSKYAHFYLTYIL